MSVSPESQIGQCLQGLAILERLAFQYGEPIDPEAARCFARGILDALTPEILPPADQGRWMDDGEHLFWLEPALAA